MATDEHYYLLGANEQPLGPLRRDEVMAEIEAGRISAQTRINKAGSNDWVSAVHVPEFAALVNATLANNSTSKRNNGISEFLSQLLPKPPAVPRDLSPDTGVIVRATGMHSTIAAIRRAVTMRQCPPETMLVHQYTGEPFSAQQAIIRAGVARPRAHLFVAVLIGAPLLLLIFHAIVFSGYGTAPLWLLLIACGVGAALIWAKEPLRSEASLPLLRSLWTIKPRRYVALGVFALAEISAAIIGIVDIGQAERIAAEAAQRQEQRDAQERADQEKAEQQRIAAERLQQELAVKQAKEAAARFDGQRKHVTGTLRSLAAHVKRKQQAQSLKLLKELDTLLTPVCKPPSPIATDPFVIDCCKSLEAHRTAINKLDHQAVELAHAMLWSSKSSSTSEALVFARAGAKLGVTGAVVKAIYARRQDLVHSLDAKAKAKERAEKEREAQELSKRRGPKPKNSAWDGSVPEVERWLRANLKDADSYEHVESSPVTGIGDYWIVRCKYRAKNSFGAKILEERLFSIQGGRVVKAVSY